MRSSFSRLTVLVATGSFLLLPTFARAQVALRADFEDFAAGTSLAGGAAIDLPGDPSGDAVQPALGASGSTITIEDDVADFDSHALHMVNPGGPGGLRATFWLPPDSRDGRRYMIRWKAAVFTHDEFFLSVAFRDETSGYYGSVDYRRVGNVTVNGTTGVGFFAGVGQVSEYQVLLDFDEGLTRFWIDGVEYGVPQRIFPANARLARVGFEMGLQLAREFALDDLEILVDAAAVSGRAASFGEMKSQFGRE